MRGGSEIKKFNERKETPAWLRHIAHFCDEDDLRHISMQMWHCQIEDLLENSCFYYCSGSDITPIIAFEGSVHSFIYSDNCCYQEYDAAIFKLKQSLRDKEFEEIQKTNINLEFFRLHKYDLARIEFRNYGSVLRPLPSGEFSIWRKKEVVFSLTYLCWDDICVWRNLFERYRIYPMVVCNCNPEGSFLYDEWYDQGGQSVWTEKNLPQYVIGHENKFGGDYFEMIGEVEYFGDYSCNSAIFERINDDR